MADATAVVVATPIPGVTPARSILPKVFTDAAAKVAADAKIVELYLSSCSLPRLKQIEDALKNGGPLPFNLDSVKAHVVSFLEAAIALATDLATIAQMFEELSAIAAVPIVASTQGDPTKTPV